MYNSKILAKALSDIAKKEAGSIYKIYAVICPVIKRGE